MKQDLKDIINNSFYQLLVIYTLLIFVIALGFLSKYTLYFNILALIIAILGISILGKENTITKDKSKINNKLHIALFIFAILLILIFRIIPYTNNQIPLGYDAGIYKYIIDNGLSKGDKWIISGITTEPGFLYLMSFFHIFLSSDFIITTLLILFCVLLGISVYFVVKEFSDKKTALISLFIYAFSIIQLKAFSYMYYKNILGMILILSSIYFLKKSEKNKNFIWLFIIFGGLVGSIHRPSFYIFGISYFFYALISPYKNKKYDFKKLGKNLLYGIIITIIAGLFYLGKFSQEITIMFEPVLQGFIQPGESPGTFINFTTFQFSSLFYFIKRKDFNILVVWAIINFIIIYFQFFFFNRFIIFLDLVLIIFSAIGFSLIIKDAKKLGIIITIILLFSASILTLKESKTAKPIITQTQLDLIKQLNNTQANSSVISLSSEYSPYVLAYSNRKTIAPGLFDEDKWDKNQWNTFWTTSEKNTTINLMSEYSKPIYMFIGNKPFNNPCFKTYKEIRDNKILKYNC